MHTPSLTTPSTAAATAPRAARRRRPLAAGLGAASAAALLTLATATPALAHDQLLSTSPEAGSTVESAPSELSLEFSGNLITGQGIQNLVSVTDEDGHQWQDGDAQVTGPELAADLCEGMPNGDYEVSYRVVYSDGHSEEKQFGFTLDDPAGPDSAVPEDCGVPNPEAAVSDTEDTAATDGATAPAAGAGGEPATGPAQAEDPAQDAAAQDAQAQEAQEQSGLPGWVLPVGIAGVVVVAAAVVLVFRKARAIDGPNDGGSGSAAA